VSRSEDQEHAQTVAVHITIVGEHTRCTHGQSRVFADGVAQEQIKNGAWVMAEFTVTIDRRGGVSLLDFLDAQRTYRETALEHLRALGNLRAAVDQLEAAIGGRLEE